MELLKTILESGGGADLSRIGQQLGIGSDDVQKVMEQVVPALGRGVKRNASSPSGLDGLLGALKNGGHQKYLGKLDDVVSAAGIAEGNGILGHILGSKDVSRNVAANASSATGVSSDAIKKMLPMLATMAMGALSKQTDAGSKLASSGGDQGGGLLKSLLDSDQDGSVMDDVLNLAKRFF